MPFRKSSFSTEPGARARFVARWIGALLFLAAVFLPVLDLWADAPTVTAVLTSSETDVDRPVQLQIKVTGDSGAVPPNDIAVDGLDIRYTGQSQLVEGRYFRFTYSFVYNYTILPLKAGTLPFRHRQCGPTARSSALPP